ncbi:MAG: ATP-dependent DNA helicase Rep [Lysobacterales bacterium 69-70]|nr:UvrD-helicase domain-containing protein [Xanthomonadaceae bacterium]ODU35584.1 MAG: ATP-dependent DNA helicase Rep [Xanthomonadaceae bacterium SCN 69-320]ODV22959.1 MAG: ATP-dependent DNA helicase Rep [Xanthomonadaceae bacterium SCN 69-25]OJY96729.1 MAG: ATP-dependent DNA helicase Rep [Xanthomonadales bacterium 69-70]
MLNPAQRAAVDYCDGPLLVLAGAGSGKTSVITQKIAHLVSRRNLPAAKIAAITFTNKAAREMRERVGKLVSGAAAEALTVCTFHAMGLKFLQIEHAKLGLKRGFSILDADDGESIIKDLLPKGLKSDQLWALRNLVSTAKNNGLDPAQALAAARSPRELEAAQLYEGYQKRLNAFNAVDFDDLIRLPLTLLEQDADTRTAWQERIRYLLVDEYQDTNSAQYRLIRNLCGPRGAFTAVGDDDQSIYAWRGANPENLDDLARDYPNLKVVKLEQNYRCAKRILRAANKLIANNPHKHLKQLFSDLPEGPPIRVMECKDSEHEAERVAADLTHLAEKSKSKWQDFAVLYRGNHQSRALEKALRLARVPYHISGGTAFLDRGEVKDVLAYLRLITNPDDDSAFLRIANVPRRDIGATTLEKLGELAQQRHASLLEAARSDAVLKQLAPRSASSLAGFAELIAELRSRSRELAASELVDELVRRTRYAEHLTAEIKDPAARQRRLDNLTELADWFRAMQKGASSAGDLAAQLALLTHSDRDDPGDSVRLMTLHGAKGLEFRFVFIVGVEDGQLPHEGSLEEGRLDEERRLMYVGITRAKERLCLSYAARSRRFGEILRNEPSRFLAEIPAEDLHWDGRDAEQDAQARKDVAAAHLARLANLLAD